MILLSNRSFSPNGGKLYGLLNDDLSVKVGDHQLSVYADKAELQKNVLFKTFCAFLTDVEARIRILGDYGNS